MSDQRYRSFVPKEDNVGQKISAVDINALQDAIDEQQQVNFAQDDQLFLDSALTTLMNHIEANSVIVESYGDNEMIDAARSKGARYHAPSRAVYFDEYQLQQSVLYTNPLRNPNNRPIKKLVLMINNMNHSSTASVTYEYSYDGGTTFYPILPNQNATVDGPVEVLTEEVVLRFTINRMDTREIVRLDGWALLYQDDTYAFRFLDDGLDIDILDGWDGTIVL